MRKSLLLVLLVAVITVLSGTMCLADAPDSSYIMVLNDEFDGTNLNTDIWAYRTGEPYGGKNLQENVRVSDGKLYLDYRKVDGFYTGGGVLTLANLPYGYYETKAKTYTGANGFHTSFWTAAGNSSMSHKPERLPQDGSYLPGQPLGQGQRWASCAMEHLGRPGRKHRIHSQSPQQPTRSLPLLHHGQKQVNTAHIAVSQLPGRLSRAFDQFNG